MQFCSPELQETNQTTKGPLRGNCVTDRLLAVGGTYHSEYGECDDHREGGVGRVGAGVDVWVAGLIELQHAEAGNHVHEGGV